MHRLRVLAVVYNPIAYDGRVHRASQALSMQFDVTVVCPRGPALTAEHGFRVHEVRQSSSRTGVVPFLRFIWSAIREGLRVKPRVVHAHDYYMMWPGLLIAWLTRAKLVYDAHELIVPDSTKATSRRGRIFYRLERAGIRWVDVVIAANRERADVMRRAYRLAVAPTVVRNIPEPIPAPEGLEPSSPNKDRKTVRLVYQGDISYARGLERFLHAVAFLPANFRLVLIGSGPDASRVASDADRLGISSRCHLHGRVSRDRLPLLLRDCDIGIVTYSYRGLNNIYCAPNKVFEYAQLDLPMVSTDQPPLRCMFSEYGLGVIVKRSDSAQDIATSITKMAQNLSVYRANLAPFLSANTWKAEREPLTRAFLRLAGGKRQETK